MKERSISFSTPMVQAERAGRKTITRRTVKVQPLSTAKPENLVRSEFHGPRAWYSKMPQPGVWNSGNPVKCPYGDVGDILKVKEAAWMWCEKVRDGLTPKKRPKFRYVPVLGIDPIYAADLEPKAKPACDPLLFKNKKDRFGWRLKIPRFLPAWAVRTRLEVVSVRVERLQRISEADALAEGIEPVSTMGATKERWRNYMTPASWFWSAVNSFASLWESINGPDSWSANPFVWVIEFRRVEGRAAA